jgi:DNA-binding response OmpR family regulator
MSDGRRAVVLVADDDKHLLDLLVVAIRKLGYDVVSAPDGATALELARSTRPDLAVVDVAMPNLDGLELTRRLRMAPETARTKILLLTAFAQSADRDEGLAAGADAYMTKPFQLDDLADRLRALAEQVGPGDG